MICLLCTVLKIHCAGPLLSISISRELFPFSSEKFSVTNFFNNFLPSVSIIIWGFQLVGCKVPQTYSVFLKQNSLCEPQNTESGLSDFFLTSSKDSYIEYHFYFRYIGEKLIDNIQ